MLWYGGKLDLPHPYIEVFSTENVSLTGQGGQQAQEGQEGQGEGQDAAE